MDDIFLDDPRQTSAQKIARNPKNKKAPRRRFRQYLADLIIKSLLLAALLALDFTLFAEAGSYSLFSPDQTLTPEATWIYTAIAATSLAIILLCSFSLSLQNFIISLGAALFLLAIFNQFAQFDQSAVLAAYFGTARTGSGTDIFSGYSHLVLAAALMLVSFLVLTFSRRLSQFYLLAILLLITGGLIGEAYFNPVSRSFNSKLALNDESSHPESINVAFIALNNAPSYFQLQNMNPGGKSQDIRQAAENMLGFYQQNNFTYYPYAYTRYQGQPFLNLADTLNPQASGTPENLLLSDVLVNGYWNFKRIGHETIYLKNNDVFKNFHQKDYNLRIYQSQGINLCNIDNRLSVNRCIEKVNQPISFKDLNLTMPQKTILLASQWLESTGLVSGITPVLSAISVFDSNISPLHFSTKDFYTLNSFKMLDMVAEDILQDHGNNAYFAVLDVPGTVFIYDNLCNIKPISRWIDANDTSTPLAVRQKALAEQTSCTYGQLENFMQKLQKGGKLAQTTVIIQSLNTPFPAMPGAEKDMFKSLQNTKQTGIAVFDPLKNQADIDYKLCTTTGIMNNWLNKKSCSELEGFTITDQLRDEIYKKATSQQLPNRQIEESITAFKSWYNSWAAHNQLDNNLDENIPLEKKAEAEEKEIKNIPVAKAEELAPEAETQPLADTDEADKKEPAKQPNVSETPQDVRPATPAEQTTAQAVSNTPQSGDAATEKETQPLSKPEQLKQQFKQQNQKDTLKKGTQQTPAKNINIQVKVIDNNETNDVVPEFVLGDLKYKPAEPNAE